MTQTERMRVFKKAWVKTIERTLYSPNISANAIGAGMFLGEVSMQLFPDNNLTEKLDFSVGEKYVDMRSLKHDIINLTGSEIIPFTSANDLTESMRGSSALYLHGENSRLLKKLGTQINACVHLGNGYFIDNMTGSSFTWDGYKYDNEFEPRLLYGAKFNYNPTVHVDDVYVRPNNIGDNNDEVVWRDFWDSICL